MANRPRKKIQKKLRKSSFVKVEAKRHEKWYFQPYGIPTDVYGVISRGSGYKDYGSKILSYLADELKLSNPQLLEFIDCTIDMEGLIDLYTSMGVFQGKEEQLQAEQDKQRNEGSDEPQDQG